MMQAIIKDKTQSTLLLLLSSILFFGNALAVQTGSSQGYATDKFDGFEAIDHDNERVAQKDKSFWYSVRETTPEAQLAYAVRMETEGHVRSARKGYEALIREWPTVPQTVTAQTKLAHLYESIGKYDKAFDEYQYLLTYFAGHCLYNEILDRQFRIANDLLHNNRSMFGWLLNGTDTIRGRFEQIVRNAPRAANVPEIMLIIGSLRVSADEYDEAIAVYDGLLNRFPNSPQAISAVFLAAQCRHTLALKHNSNEARCREAIAFFKAVMHRVPNHPQKEQMTAWLNELNALLIEQNYKQAVFYDTRQRNEAAAKTAYHRFLSEFPDSQHAKQVRARLAELEKKSQPAK